MILLVTMLFLLDLLLGVQVDVPRYQVGDAVRVMDDRAEVSKLQKNHGGWVEEMSDVSTCNTTNRPL